MALVYRRLTAWPPGRARVPLIEQEGSPFRAAHDATIEQLERELRHVSAAGAAVQIDVESARELRGDGGGPRIDARMRSSAVVLTFRKQIYVREQWNDVPVTFASAKFDLWQDNLRAITLGMEALRRVERYGITSAGEQYRGFAALPSSTTPAVSTDQAADIIRGRSMVDGATAQSILASATVAKEYVRIARAKTHQPESGARADHGRVHARPGSRARPWRAP